MSLAPGAFVTPTLRLVRQLGQGGMGGVWVADHLALHTQVVIKFMADRFAQDPKWVERFRREAAAAAQIRSPHVAQVFDHGVTPTGVPYIVMELLEGHDLTQRIKQRGCLPPHEMSIVLLQLSKALGKAHERGIIHRDIKPDNIFLCDAGHGEFFVKLLDFGIAKGGEALTDATNTGAVMGTPYYMSPEQMIGAKNVDHRSDLWSVAVVTYLAITGVRPFSGDTYGALAVAIASGPLPAPSSVNPALSPSIDAWFAKACARDPAQRFGSARELADAFSVAIHGQAMATGAFMAPGFSAGTTGASYVTTTGEPITRTPSETAQPATKKSNAKWAVLGGVAVLAIAGIGATAFALSSKGSTSAASPKTSEVDDGEPAPKKSKAKPSADPEPAKESEPEPAPTAAATATDPIDSAEELAPDPQSTGATAKPAAKPQPTAQPQPSAQKPQPKPTPKSGKYDDDIK